MARIEEQNAGSSSSTPAVPPGIKVVAGLTRYERQAQEQRWDAVDSKAGAILGAAGVTVTLAVALGGGWYLLGALPAVWSGVLAALALQSADFERQDPAKSYQDWANLDEHAALWQAHSDELRTLKNNEPRYDLKVKRLVASWRAMAAAIVALPLIAILELILPLIQEP